MAFLTAVTCQFLYDHARPERTDEMFSCRPPVSHHVAIMFRLGWLLLVICAVCSSGLECKKRLDVVSADQWPVLKKFKKEHVAKGVLLDVGYGSTVENTQAFLHTRNKETYVYPDSTFFYQFRQKVMRKIVELDGRAVKDIQMGYDFIAILTEDGYVWTSGRNEHGQLSGDTTPHPTFTVVQGLPPVTKMAVGYSHVVVVTDDGRLFSWGLGSNGRLGYSSGDINPTPRSFSGVSSPTQICCTSDTCMALTESGGVYTWGHHYQIGRSGTNYVPGRVSSIPSGGTIIKVACGVDHMLALSSNGQLYGWGRNAYNEILQAPIYASSGTALDLDGKLVSDVVAGRYMTIVRTDSDDVYSFGSHNGTTYTTPHLWTNSPGFPRDMMARGYIAGGQETRDAVKMNC